MRYIVDVPEEVDGQIQQLIQEGKYELAQDFILTSIKNWLYIEKRDPEPSVQANRASKEFSAKGISNYLVKVPSKTLEIVDEPLDNILYSNEPLWGLANRLFPVKITVRVLANMLAATNRGSVDRDELLENAFNAASNLGSLLNKADKKRDRKRSERLSDALPSNPKDTKSKSRYFSQFVGGMTYSTGKMFGAPVNLKFINMFPSSDGSVMVALTNEGLQFAKLDNPVIDEQNYESSSFSQEEVRYLIQHIFEKLPGEAKGIFAILSEISEGNTSTNGFIPIIKGLFNYPDDTRATTVKVGLIGRMVELGLIEREKMGLKVKFKLSILGENVLKRHTENRLHKGVEA